MKKSRKKNVALLALLAKAASSKLTGNALAAASLARKKRNPLDEDRAAELEYLHSGDDLDNQVSGPTRTELGRLGIQVLQILSKTGGGSLTRREIEEEAGSLRRRDGKPVAEATARIEAGKAIKHLVEHGFMRRRPGRGLLAEANSDEFQLEELGEMFALQERRRSARELADEALAAGIAAQEEKPEEVIEAEERAERRARKVAAERGLHKTGLAIERAKREKARAGKKHRAFEKRAPLAVAAKATQATSAAEGRVRQMGRAWWVRGFGSRELVPSPFKTKSSAVAYARRNEQAVKELGTATDADERAVLVALAPKAKIRRTVKLSSLLENAPPGGWTESDRVPAARRAPSPARAAAAKALAGKLAKGKAAPLRSAEWIKSGGTLVHSSGLARVWAPVGSGGKGEARLEVRATNAARGGEDWEDEGSFPSARAAMAAGSARLALPRGIARPVLEPSPKKAAGPGRTRTIVAPHAAKRPPCKLCKINHSPRAHARHAIDGSGRRETLVGRVVEEIPLMRARKKNPGRKAKKRNPECKSRMCAAGRHDFDPTTLACTRKHCTAKQNEPGTQFLFGYDPDAEADRIRRERASGQSELFRGDAKSAGSSSLFKNPRRSRRNPDDVRALERALAAQPTDRAARAALRRAKNRAGEGVRMFTRDLAEEVSGDRGYSTRAAHAAGLRAVLKKHKAEKLGGAKAALTAPSYSMASTVHLDIKGGMPEERDALSRKIGRLFDLSLYPSGTSIQVWQREAAPEDPGADYGTPGRGPTIAPEDQEAFIEGFATFVARDEKTSAGRKARGEAKRSATKTKRETETLEWLARAFAGGDAVPVGKIPVGARGLKRGDLDHASEWLKGGLATYSAAGPGGRVLTLTPKGLAALEARERALFPELHKNPGGRMKSKKKSAKKTKAKKRRSSSAKCGPCQGKRVKVNPARVVSHSPCTAICLTGRKRCSCHCGGQCHGRGTCLSPSARPKPAKKKGKKSKKAKKRGKKNPLLAEVLLAANPGKKKAAAKPVAKKPTKKPKKAKRAKKRRAKVTTTTTKTVRVVKSNPGAIALPVGRRVKWKDMPESVKRDPLARAAATRAARLHGIPLDELEGEVCETPAGTARHLVGSGELLSYKYAAAKGSARAFTSRGARIEWEHESGDHGRGKKRTRRMLLATDPRTGQPVLVSRRGSRVGFSSRRGHLG